MPHDADDRCCAVLTGSSVISILSVFAVIDRNRVAFRECNRITNLLATLHNRTYTLDIIIVLQGRNNGLQRRYIGIHLIAECLQCLESRPGGQFDLCPVGKCKNHIIVAGFIIDSLKHWIAVLSIVSGRLAELFPALFSIIRYLPITIDNF